MSKKRIAIERVYDASIEDVWEMWTTQEGIEAWWGPDGFRVTVSQLELRAGGKMVYAMTAVGEEQIAFMKREKMPLSTELTVTFTEVTPPRRLAYTSWVDFVPGQAPYDTGTLVELSQVANGVKLVLTIDAMHDEVWTQRAVMGWTMELGKLDAALRSTSNARANGAR